jgi:hypothetical protein
VALNLAAFIMVDALHLFSNQRSMSTDGNFLDRRIDNCQEVGKAALTAVKQYRQHLLDDNQLPISCINCPSSSRNIVCNIGIFISKELLLAVASCMPAVLFLQYSEAVALAAITLCACCCTVRSLTPLAIQQQFQQLSQQHEV